MDMNEVAENEILMEKTIKNRYGRSMAQQLETLEKSIGEPGIKKALKLLKTVHPDVIKYAFRMLPPKFRFRNQFEAKMAAIKARKTKILPKSKIPLDI